MEIAFLAETQNWSKKEPGLSRRGERQPLNSMMTKNMRQLLEIIEAEVRARPSAFEFEMAYQARVVIDRIKFAIRHMEQFTKSCAESREAGLELLDALERLQAMDRQFQARSGTSEHTRNGTDTEATASSTISVSQRN